MQTNLRSKAGGPIAAALLLVLGLATQVHGAGLFFLKDSGKTNTFQTFKPLAAPVTTNAFEAKVVVVNRYDQTFTIEHEGKLHLFRVEPGTQLFNTKGKRTTLDWITAGQTLLVKAGERPSGRLDLLAATVLPNREQYQAAGKKKKETAPAPEPVVFPSEDARPSVIEETPLPVEEPVVPAPTDEPQPEPAPENAPAPEAPEPKS